MLKPLSGSIIASLLLISPASATISIAFNNPFFGNVSEGLADSSMTVSNGLAYGIVIDTTGNGFGSLYDPDFTLTRGSLISLTTMNGVATDDQLWLSAGVSLQDVSTHDTSGFTESDFVTTGGPGGVSGISSIPSSAANKRFALIWFDAGQALDASVTEGRNFGLLTDASFVLPNDGVNNEIFDEPFAGSDTVRPATSGQFSVIPEPSTALIGLLGLAGLLRRKR